MASSRLMQTHVKRIISPALVDNASATNVEMDTVINGAKAHRVRIGFLYGASDIAMTALKIQESDASGSGFADVTGLVFGTSADSAGTTTALPSATDDDSLWMFDIDLTNRKRYLDIVATCGNGTLGSNVAAIAIFDVIGQTPNSDTEYGADAVPQYLAV